MSLRRRSRSFAFKSARARHGDKAAAVSEARRGEKREAELSARQKGREKESYRHRSRRSEFDGKINGLALQFTFFFFLLELRKLAFLSQVETASESIDRALSIPPALQLLTRTSEANGEDSRRRRRSDRRPTTAIDAFLSRPLLPFASPRRFSTRGKHTSSNVTEVIIALGKNRASAEINAVDSSSPFPSSPFSPSSTSF